MYFNQLARRIINVNHSVVRPAVVLRVVDCVRGVQILQPAKRQSIRDQIKAALVFARSDFVNVFNLCHVSSRFYL